MPNTQASCTSAQSIMLEYTSALEYYSDLHWCSSTTLICSSALVLLNLCTIALEYYFDLR